MYILDTKELNAKWRDEEKNEKENYKQNYKQSSITTRRKQLHTTKKLITDLFAFFPVFDTISVLHIT